MERSAGDCERKQFWGGISQRTVVSTVHIVHVVIIQTQWHRVYAWCTGRDGITNLFENLVSCCFALAFLDCFVLCILTQACGKNNLSHLPFRDTEASGSHLLTTPFCGGKWGRTGQCHRVQCLGKGREALIRKKPWDVQTALVAFTVVGLAFDDQPATASVQALHGYNFPLSTPFWADAVVVARDIKWGGNVLFCAFFVFFHF